MRAVGVHNYIIYSSVCCQVTRLFSDNEGGGNDDSSAAITLEPDVIQILTYKFPVALGTAHVVPCIHVEAKLQASGGGGGSATCLLRWLVLGQITDTSAESAQVEELNRKEAFTLDQDAAKICWEDVNMHR